MKTLNFSFSPEQRKHSRKQKTCGKRDYKFLQNLQKFGRGFLTFTRCSRPPYLELKKLKKFHVTKLNLIPSNDMLVCLVVNIYILTLTCMKIR